MLSGHILCIYKISGCKLEDPLHTDDILDTYNDSVERQSLRLVIPGSSESIIKSGRYPRLYFVISVIKSCLMVFDNLGRGGFTSFKQSLGFGSRQEIGWD
jgi:hypothetical protein